MFPGLRQRFDTALDLIVEFSTLGEYRLAAPAAGGPASAPVAAVAEAAGTAGCAPMSSVPGPRMGGAGGHAARSADQQVAGGAAASARGAAVRAPLRGAAATPAARRLAASRSRGTGHRQSAGLRARRGLGRPAPGKSPHRVRGGAPAVPEQLCLAV
jgi:hypothetical protein